MDKWRNKIAVVTGASSGIGANLVERLVEEGLQVVGLARRKEIVENISLKLTKSPGKLYAIKCDITKEDEVLNTFAWIKKHLGPVQILINNAAVITGESITNGSTASWKLIIDTCIFGLTLCTREIISQIREANVEGQVININSGLGHYITPSDKPIYNLYPSVKYAMTALNEVMTQEMRYYNANLRFTSLSPGLVHSTGIFKTGNVCEMAPEVVEKRPHLLPKDISDAVVYILSTSSNVQIYELMLQPFQVNN